ncbi:MAG: PTS sugar transporter subunit IIA [Treponema sp.]|nr:PTS sugar transporter subunit IIA [Treponema sp.]
MTEKTATDWSLAALIERGGVYDNIPGSTPKEILAAVLDLLPAAADIGKEGLLKGILEREALVSTGIGRGIALPHPRNPLAENGPETPPSAVPLVAVAYPVQPIEWNAPDGNKVHTVFLIISLSVKQHLNTLSKINFLCQQERFYSLIEARFSKEVIVTAIRDAEASWARSSS